MTIWNSVKKPVKQSKKVTRYSTIVGGKICFKLEEPGRPGFFMTGFLAKYPGSPGFEVKKLKKSVTNFFISIFIVIFTYNIKTIYYEKHHLFRWASSGT